jgi:hypothetical protein
MSSFFWSSRFWFCWYLCRVMENVYDEAKIRVYVCRGFNVSSTVWMMDRQEIEVNQCSSVGNLRNIFKNMIFFTFCVCIMNRSGLVSPKLNMSIWTNRAQFSTETKITSLSTYKSYKILLFMTQVQPRSF